MTEPCHSTFYLPTPQRQSSVRGKEDHHSLCPLKSLMGGAGVCVSLVLFFFFNSMCLWAAWSPRRLTIVGIGLSVTFKRLGIHHRTHALRYISWTLLQWHGRRQVSLEPLRLVKSTWKDLHVHGLVMDGRLQGVSEESDLSSFSEVRPLKSNIQHSTGNHR